MRLWLDRRAEAIDQHAANGVEPIRVGDDDHLAIVDHELDDQHDDDRR